MKLDREEFLGALDDLGAGLSPKELVQQMTHYNFMGKYIVTYNDLVSIYHPFETGFVCSVKAESFRNVLSKIKESELNIEKRSKEVEKEVKNIAGEVTGTKMVTIHTLFLETETTEAEFPVSLEGDLTESLVNLEKELEGEWEALPEDFAEAAYLCMFSASRDAQTGTLTCLRVEGSDLFACDGNRAMWYKVETDMQDFLIKAGCAKELRDLEVTSYKISKSWVHFKNEKGVVVNIRKILGEYKKKIRDIFKIEEGEEFLMPVELKEAIDLCGVVYGDSAITDKQVFLSIENKIAICSSTLMGGISVKKSVPIPFYNGQDLSFYINSVFIDEVIERTPPDENGEKRPQMLVDVKSSRACFVNDKFKHVFMLNTKMAPPK